MEFKGTQGDWKVGDIDPTRVWSKENGIGGIVGWCTNEAHNSDFYLDKDYETQKANAKLIAAAPDLLKALQVFVNFPKEDLEGWIDEGKPVTMTVQSSDMYEALNAINKALK